MPVTDSNQPKPEPIPLGLYIHIPWCVKKCPYCDFNSHAMKAPLPETAYVARLLEDFAIDWQLADKRPIRHIFIGGGTPSLFSPAAFEALFAGIHELVGIDDIEITLEANPGTVEQSLFEGFRAAGINRLSIGIQSTNPTHLKALGRIHSREEGLDAIQSARQAGFEAINADLMYGLPNQSIEEMLKDLENVKAAGPSHLSWYQLTLEPNTYFYRFPPKLPDDDKLADMTEVGLAWIAEQGFQRYEISAYQTDAPCQHNINYWSYGDYIGIGAGAHGKLTQGNDVLRTVKWRHPKDYLDLSKNCLQQQTLVDEATRAFEFMLNAMRLTHGVDTHLFAERTKQPLANIQPGLDKAVQLGLLQPVGKRIQPTQLGLIYLNNLVELFLPRIETRS